MSNNHIEQLKEMVKDPPIKWMKLAGIRPEIIEQGHIRFVLPVEGLHLNHVNTVYAGSIFAFAETCGGAAFQSTYGFDRFVPIVKNASIRYLKPATQDLVCELEFTPEEAEKMIAPIQERGRGDFPLSIPVCDAGGVEVAVADITYYIIPADGGALTPKKE